jgi:cytochrome c-type biogenesis protein CcmH
VKRTLQLLAAMLAATVLGVASGLAVAQGPVSVGAPAAAPGQAPALSDAELVRSDRFRRLASELRCLVCQNQSLADSNAELAVDLRDEVVRLMRTGQDDQQIKRHLVDRYGDFVLYRPTFEPRNWALWLGPFVMLAIGAGVLWRMSRRRAHSVPGPVSREEAERIRRLLDDPS